MGQRFAVLAAVHHEALIRRARSRAWLVALALVSLVGAADAKPKRRDAKQAYERGIAAYQKRNYELASTQFSRSYDLERDVDTLFAWAQAERRLDHCDKASELYERLLAGSLTEANRTAVEGNLAECKTLIAAQKPAPVAAEPRPAEPRPAPEARPAAPEPKPAAAEPAPPVVERPAVAPEPEEAVVAAPPRAWYKDPLALGLLGGGVVVAGVGGGFLVSASSAANADPHSHPEAVDDSHKATSRGYIGQAGLAVGGALLIGGVIRIVTHRGAEHRTVTGWLAPGGGGLTVAGAF